MAVMWGDSAQVNELDAVKKGQPFMLIIPKHERFISYFYNEST
jgi:hypothetical protein